MGRGIIIEEEINRLKAKVDRLEVERNRYREALEFILQRGKRGYHGVLYIARQALKDEVR